MQLSRQALRFDKNSAAGKLEDPIADSFQYKVGKRDMYRELEQVYPETRKSKNLACRHPEH